MISAPVSGHIQASAGPDFTPGAGRPVRVPVSSERMSVGSSREDSGIRSPFGSPFRTRWFRMPPCVPFTTVGSNDWSD